MRRGHTLVQKHVGCFCCDTEYRLLLLLPLFGKELSMQEKYDNNTTPAVDLKPDPDFLPFTNDFIFSLVMRDPTLCRELLALALPEEDFGEIKIMKSQNPLIDEPADGAAEAANTETQPDSARSDTRALTVETQKSLKFVKDMHGVRFDAYVKSENAMG